MVIIKKVTILTERGDHMKIYLFDLETRSYLGEDFADPPVFKGGAPLVPPGATTSAPPPYPRGEVPVFRAREQRWEIRSIASFASGGTQPMEAGRTDVEEATFSAAHAEDLGGMTRKVLLLVFAAFLFLPASLSATSYVPLPKEPVSQKEEEVMTAGARVQLFHSGGQEGGGAIKPGDVLAVYREIPAAGGGSVKETGKVRVTAASGAYYLEGEVIEGHVGHGYLALKEGVACMVTTRLKPKH